MIKMTQKNDIMFNALVNTNIQMKIIFTLMLIIMTWNYIHLFCEL